jgi:hypothetical protein
MLVQRRVGPNDVLFHQGPRSIGISVNRLIDVHVAHHMNMLALSGT